MKKVLLFFILLNYSFSFSQEDVFGNIPADGVTPLKREIKKNPSKVIEEQTTNKGLNQVLGTPTGTSTEVGNTEGQLSVSLTGGANYSIPISLPPGINGVVPQISLNYNSQSGNGLAGYGWNIGGISVISRIPSTKFHDNLIDPVDFDSSDRFAIDGQRLIVKNGTTGVYGANGTVYETENYSNIKVTSYGTHPKGVNFGPAYFVVEYPDGSIGNYSTSSLTNWAITYWQNPQGARISYSYNYTIFNSLNISYITYGTLSSTMPINIKNINVISFVYKNRTRKEVAYVGGHLSIEDKVLSEINVKSNSTDYSIGYSNYLLEHDSSSLGYDRLIKITEKSGDNSKSYNPTVFSYDTTSEVITNSSISTSLSIGNINYQNSATVSGDFNGDGKMDFILYPTTGTNAKKIYWLFNDIQPNSLNLGAEHNVGTFDEIFPISWLGGDATFGYKLMPMQGWCVLKNNPTTNTTSFTNYSTGSSSPIYIQDNKNYIFPKFNVTTSQLDYSGTSATYLKNIPKKYISGDFNGDGISDVLVIEQNCTFSIPGTPIIDPVTGDITIPPNTYINYVGQTYLVNLDRRLTSNYVSTVGQINMLSGSQLIVDDVNGDGKSDLMLFWAGYVKVFTLNESSQLQLLWTTTDSLISPVSPLIGDYNGDGKTDFIIPKGIGNNYAKFTSTGIGFFRSDEVYDIPNNPNSGTACPQIFYIIPADFNQDGKTDLILAKNVACPNTSGTGYISIRNYKNTGTNFVSDMYTTTEFQPGIGAYAVPVFLNSNKQNSRNEINFITNNKIIHFNSKKDFNIDRLLKSITLGNGVMETINYSPLDYDSTSYENPFTASTYKENYPNFDINTAKGFKVVSRLEKTSQNQYAKQDFQYYGAVSNLEGLGFLGFRSLSRTNWYNDDNQIITSISQFDPNLRGANVANYTYLGLYSPTIVANAAAPNSPRASTIIINDTRTATETVQATNSIRFLPGATISPTSGNSFVAQITPDYDANGFAETNTTPPYNLISKSISFYEASLSSSKVYNLKNIQSNTYNILENTSSETVTVYDAYNNPTESISKIRNGGVGEQTTTSTITYESVSSPYMVGRPSSKIQTVTSSGDSMTSKETYGYGTGTESNLLKTIQKWANNTSSITEANLYDTFGNITKKTISATGIADRVTNYKYEPSGRFLEESYDIEGLKTSYVYNPIGTLQSETNPYGLTTSYLYDSWFKKIQTTDYLGKKLIISYQNLQGFFGLSTEIRKVGDDGSSQSIYYDDLGREVSVANLNIIGASYSKTVYDIYDRKIKVYEPFNDFSSYSDPGLYGTLFSTTSFDEYGRIKESKSYTGKTVTISYSGLSSTVNDGTKTKTYTKNAMGNIVSMTETPGGTINYTYFANGNLKTTNYDGVETVIEQDDWGRKTKLTDPSAGEYRYTYNGFGETTSEITPNGTTTYNLDDFGRLSTKTIIGNKTNSQTTYNYDPTSKLLNSSVFEDLQAGTTTTYTYFYDNSKQLYKTTEDTPNLAKFTKEFKFDSFGRVDKEISIAELNGKSSSITVKNTYKNGYPWQILSDEPTPKVLWQTNTVNARGQLLTAQLGNGVAITNTYDTYGYFTQFKHDKTGLNPANIMTLNTTFDPVKGNLKTRTNSMFAWSEDFTNSYDNQDRLTSYKTIKNAQEVIENQDYDDKGKITQNSLGSYNYLKTEYQNSSITLTPEAKIYYDTDAKRQQTIDYNVFKSPYEITEGNEKISFAYNDSNARSIMYYGGAGLPNTRQFRKHYSADGTMEIKQDIVANKIEFITYIGGDGYSAPLVYRQTHDATTPPLGVGGLLYLHRDYLGSIVAITNENATIVEKRLFDAWGSLINYYNATGAPFGGWGAFDRGYTGHEHLQSVGLINMNGRIYDPKLHRFLQPDNYIQDPFNTQNYNRYGYVLNNPLKYVDYSGETSENPPTNPEFSNTNQTFIGNLIYNIATNWDNWGIKEWSHKNFNLNRWSNQIGGVGQFLGRNIKSIGNWIGNNIKSIFGIKDKGPNYLPATPSFSNHQLSAGWQNEGIQNTGTTSAGQYYGGDGSGSIMDYFHRFVYETDQYNPIALAWDGLKGYFTGSDRYGNSLTGTQSTIKILSAIPITKAGTILSKGIGQSSIVVAKGVSVASGAGGKTLPMTVQKIIPQGSKITDIVNDVKGMTWMTGNEHAVVRLANGQKAIVSGGPGGISFQSGQIRTLFGHTHPTSAPPSLADYNALQILGQSRQYVIHGGQTTLIRP